MGIFDQQVRALNELTGEPIAGVPYKLTTEAGDVYYGVTDEEGKAERIYTIEPSKLVVEWWVTRPENSEKA